MLLASEEDMDRRLTIVEVIGMAIRSEEDSAKFYGHISKMSENEIVRAKYEALAKEEVNHRVLLLGLFQKLSDGMDNPPRVPGEPETAEKGGQIDGSETLDDLLNLAIEREHKAAAFYQKAADETRDVNSQRILQYLASMERGHEELLRNELAAFELDNDWYLKNPPELQHVGP